jgi:hypothetical protein
MGRFRGQALGDENRRVAAWPGVSGMIGEAKGARPRRGMERLPAPLTRFGMDLREDGNARASG